MQLFTELHIPTRCPHDDWERAWPILKATHPQIAQEIHEIEPAERGIITAIATLAVATNDPERVPELVADDYPNYAQFIVQVRDEHGNHKNVVLHNITTTEKAAA